jgi:hypothetical protein
MGKRQTSLVKRQTYVMEIKTQNVPLQADWEQLASGLRLTNDQ